MNNLEELEKKYEELGKEIERLKKDKAKRWRANRDEQYYVIGNYGYVANSSENGTDIDTGRYEIGNYFKTREEAEKALEKIEIKQELEDLALELNNRKEIDWNDENQHKYYIYYDFFRDKIQCNENTFCKRFDVYCLDENFKDKAIKRIGEEKLKELFID